MTSHQRMAFEPNSNLITTTNSDGNLAIWDITTPASPKKIKTLNGPISIAIFSRDGKFDGFQLIP